MKRALRLAIPAYLLLETFVTLAIGAQLGALPTLLLLLLGGVFGIAILRRQKLAMLAQLRRINVAAAPLLPGVIDGALCAAAGVLLIIPGFISDAMAAGLLIAKLRRPLVRRLAGGLGDARAAGPVVIEGDYHSVDDTALPEPRRGHR